MLLLLLACAAPEGPPPADETYGGVITRLNFGRREGELAWGFDLDHHVSDAGDEEGCYHEDLVDPDGKEGIDSSFSSLVPALEATEASAVEDLIQDSIRNGQLLLLLELSGVDDLQNDDCVDLRLVRGTGAPMLGTDNEILDAQTFVVDPDLPAVELSCMPLREGSLLAGPFSMQLPLQVLDVELEFGMTEAMIRVDLDEEGLRWGYFGGAVPNSDILRIVAEDDLADLRDLVTSLVELSADMHPDEAGVCQSLSIVFEYSTTKAFLWDE